MSIFVDKNEENDVVGFVKDIQNEVYRGFNFGLLSKLNTALYGLNTGMYYLIAGMPKSGKTTILLQIIFAVLLGLKEETDKVEFVYFELEINRRMFKAKFISLAIFVLSRGTVIPLTSILKMGGNGLTEEQVAVIAEYQPILDRMLNCIRFVPKKEVSTPALFKTKCLDIINYNEGKTTVFIIDHISILGSNRKEKIDELSEFIVDLKNEYSDCSLFIALQQANRKMYDPARRQMDGENIQFTGDDLKDTANTLQDCDVCISMFNVYELSNITKMSGYEVERCFGGLRRIDFVKHRYGTLYWIRVFLAGGVFFTELEEPSEEEYEKINKVNDLWQN